MKTIVIGLDGVSPDWIAAGVARGDLPALARIMREGAWGRLRSTVPPDSPSAWTSFATGVNPGRHGVFGFMARRSRDYGYEIGSSALVRSPTLWDLASRHGTRVGVVNVPFTYPPRPVNGFLVAGMMTPDLRSDFTHPPRLRAELLRAVPGYTITHGLGRSQGGDPRATLAERFAPTIDARERAMQWLAGKHDPDLLVCVFTVLDRLQHFLWADMDPRHPDHPGQAAGSSSSGYGEAIRDAYARLDGVVGRVLNNASPETLVIVLSDHGFEAIARTFYVNAWLAGRGLLVLSGEAAEPSGWSHRMARLARRALARLPGCGGLRERFRARRLISDAFVRAVDWRKTRAWFGLERGLWLNVAGRELLGTVAQEMDYDRLRSELIAELESIEDPETGHRVVMKVHRREEIYSGPCVDSAPDLVIEPAHDRDDPAGRYLLSERLNVRTPERFVGPSAPITGGHTPDGVLLAWGRGVEAGKTLEGAEIIDVAPTILDAMAVPGGNEMDGRRLFPDTEHRSKTPPSEPRARSEPVAPGAAMNDRERRLVEERLKNLGYID